MGIQCRLNQGWLISGVLALAALGCSKDGDAEARRQLLSARERTQARKERIDEQRIRAPTGDLLPSKVVRAGIVLPRGFNPRFEEDYSWTYDAQLPQSKVEAYFDQRLLAREVKREGGEVEYLYAREKADPNAAAERPVAVTVKPAPGRPSSWSRIVVKERPPTPKDFEVVTGEVLRERFLEQRKYAR